MPHWSSFLRSGVLEPLIRQIHLQNFRGFEDHTIQLKPLALIVRANNAGKSTVVEGLRLASLALRAIRASRFVPEPRWLDHEFAYRGVSPTTRGLDFDPDSFFHRYEPPPAIVRVTFTNGSDSHSFRRP